MRMVELIERKRDGHELNKAEIDYVIQGYTSGEIPDYQMSSFAMAVFFQGMSPEERVHLTMAMVHSGEQIDLSAIQGIKVDKHSTGGVGDTTTTKLINIKLDEVLETILNYNEWIVSIYASAKSSFIKWLNHIAGVDKITIKQFRTLTGMTQDACRSYLYYECLPQEEKMSLILKSLNTNLDSFLSYAKIDVTEKLFFMVIEQAERWKKDINGRTLFKVENC